MNACEQCGHEAPGLYCPGCGLKKGSSKAATSEQPTDQTSDLGTEQTSRTVPAPPPVIRPRPEPPPIEVGYGKVIDYPAPTQPVDVLGTQIHGIGKGTVTSRAGYIVGPTDEQMVWEESPSPLLLVGMALRWALGLSFVWLLSVQLHSWSWFGIWTFIAIARIGYQFMNLRAIVYRMSSQRLEVTQGLWHQRTDTYEVHELGDVAIFSPLYLRLFERANLVIKSPYIPLLGIRNAKGIRDLLRGAGQIEAGRTDKIRWR